MTIETLNSVSLASQIFNGGTRLDLELQAISNQFPARLTSPTEFFIHQGSGDDNDIGSNSNPWQSLEGMVSNLENSYVLDSVVTIKLLANYTVSSLTILSLEKIIGDGAIFFDLNGFRLRLDGSLFISKLSGIRAFALGSSNLFTVSRIEGTEKLRFENCQAPITVYQLDSDVDLEFTDCYRPVVRGTTPGGFLPALFIARQGGIKFFRSTAPEMVDVEVNNFQQVLFSQCLYAIATNFRVSNDAGIPQGGAYLTFLDCTAFSFTGTYEAGSNNFSRRMIEVVDSSGQLIFGDIINGHGSNVNLALNNNEYLLEIRGDSFVTYRDESNVADFFSGSGGRAFRLGDSAKVDWNTGFRSPEALPVISKVNEIGITTQLNENNYSSTIGLFSTNLATAINELGKVVFYSQPNRYISGLYPLTLVNNSQFSFVAGEFFFFDKSDRANPLIVKISVPSGSYIVRDIFFDPITPNEGVIYVYILASGIIEGSINLPTAQELDNRTVFARIAHADDQITGMEPFILENNDLTKELINEGGTRNIGVKIAPADLDPATFQIKAIGGDVMILGENSINDPLNPHTVAIAGTGEGNLDTFLTWDEYTPTGDLIEGGTTFLKFGRYYDGSLVQVFTGNDATVKFFYVNKSGQFISVVGTERYGSLNVASQRFTAFETASDFVDYALVAILIGAANGTDSTNTGSVRIINQDAANGNRLFLQSGNGGGGGR